MPSRKPQRRPILPSRCDNAPSARMSCEPYGFVSEGWLRHSCLRRTESRAERRLGPLRCPIKPRSDGVRIACPSLSRLGASSPR